MSDSQLKKALVEVDEIFKYIVPEEQLKKLPPKFFQFVKENKDHNYHFKYDESKKFEEQNLLHETELLLGALYLNYWASYDEKKEMNKILNDNEKAYLEKLNKQNNSSTNVNQVTTNNVNFDFVQTPNVNANLPVQYKKSIFQKLFSAIKNIRIFK